MSSETEHRTFWGTVHRTLETLRAEAPDGYIPRVQIRLDDGETIEPAGVGRLGSSWIYFEMDEHEAEVTPTRRVIFTYPERIARVEISFVRGEGRREIGFRVDKPITAIVADDEE